MRHRATDLDGRMNFTQHHSGSKSNLYTLTSGEHSLLIEAGVRLPAIRKATGFKLSGYDGCLCTHSHKDHSAGIPDLLAACTDCYMTQSTADALKVSGHRLHIIEPKIQFRIADYWDVMPFETEHDAPGSVGFLISDGHEKLLFITDSFYCKHLFSGVTIYAVECNWSEETLADDVNPALVARLRSSHFSLPNVQKFFEANDLSETREIHLLHLSSLNSDKELFRETIQAQTGLPVYLVGD